MCSTNRLRETSCGVNILADATGTCRVAPQLEMEKAFLRLETMERTYEEGTKALHC